MNTVTDEIDPNLTGFPTYIPARKAKEMADASGVSREEFLVGLLPFASTYSKPAISDFPVGAVAMGLPKADDFGDVYMGASFEVEKEPLTVVVHGEQSAMMNAWVHEEQGIQLLAISAPPCGYCRQFLWEVTPHPEMRVLLENDGEIEDFALHELLPHAFGPEALKRDRAFLKPQHNNVPFASEEPLVKAAIEGAKTCYSPYTSTFSAIALKTTSGDVAVGGYAENVAYNPSVSPMMSALNRLNLSKSNVSLDIERAVLVSASTKVSLAAESQAILTALGSKAELETIYFDAPE